MKHLFLSSIAVGTVALAACGANPAERELAKMHNVLGEQILQKIPSMNEQTKQATDLDVQFQTQSLLSDISGLSQLHIVASAQSDLSSKKNPLTQVSTRISGKIGGLGGTQETNAPKGTDFSDENLSFQIAVDARSIEQTLLLQVKNVSFSGFMTGTPFSLPDSFDTRWYGISFDESNKKLKEYANDGIFANAKSIEDVIQNLFGGSAVRHEVLRKQWRKMHIWKGEELLPEIDNLIRIRVSSDKRAIQKTIGAIVNAYDESYEHSWKQQLQNPEFSETIEQLTQDQATFLQEMGTIRGILMVEKETYNFAGFSGEIVDSSGVITATIDLQKAGKGNWSGTLQETKTNQSFLLQLRDGVLQISINERNIVTGQLSSSGINLVAKDAVTGNEVAKMQASFTKLSQSELRMTDGTFTFPAKELNVRVPLLEYRLIGGDSLSVDAELSVEQKGVSLFSMLLHYAKSPLAELAIELPSYEPIFMLREDLFSSLMGAMELESEPVEP